MKKYRIAAILMIFHGGFVEIGGCLALIPMLILGPDSGFDISQYFSFVIPYFQEHLNLMMIISGIYGVIRLVGAIALLKNLKWGLALSFIVTLLSLILMTFMLPAGILDGVLAGATLILLLIGYYGSQKIISPNV
ncbi:MAG: hypothetical protein WC282_02925 [Bacilli bacterium]|jgi:hypothetical protein